MKKYQQPKLKVVSYSIDVILASDYTLDYFTDSWEGGQS